MRILSQDGMIDVPYENFVFAMTGDNCIVAIRDTVARPSEIVKGFVAKYSTEAKAKRAMQMLREAYAGLPIIMQNVEITKEVEDMFKKWKKQGICIRAGEQSKVEYVNNGYFQFPSDEELEGNGWQMNLPCKVGDTIYVIDASETREYLEVEPCFIASIAIFENGKVVFYSDTYNEYDICDLDSLVNGGLYHGVYRAFLAKEEAEEELKKMKGEG